MPEGILIGKGRTAEVYRLENERVLKIFYDWVPAAWIEAEAEIGAAVHAAGVPAPAVYGLFDVDGRKGLLYQRLDGPSLLGRIEAKPWRIMHYARQMAKFHRQIHAANGAGLPGQKERMESAIRDSVALFGLGANQAPIIAHLRRLPEGSSVCHGDFHPDNILGVERKWVAIDWSNATAGNPCADVARTVLILDSPYLPPHIPKATQVLLKAVKRLLRAVYLQEYLRLARIGFEAVAVWLLPVAAARLCEQVPGETEWLLKMIQRYMKEL
ncbi:phosphotransferase family enzyme [Hydrogenispora ethanolica]|uniref:Phosphotransferase family enzyme n=1 Tax=Hydrogenispora ethanolica TaxID=1082276 RepID=A0A4R1RAG7_HYDET|nr:aminoglycoside phosphotransferase family protein [Hydrogenispora ethanolica]TCL62741.1 phosphotransferase family enzyme [Hydrogenispora ethanolica]